MQLRSAEAHTSNGNCPQLQCNLQHGPAPLKALPRAFQAEILAYRLPRDGRRAGPSAARQEVRTPGGCAAARPPPPASVGPCLGQLRATRARPNYQVLLCVVTCRSADLSVDSEFFERPEPAAAGDLKVSAQQQEEEGAGQQPTTSDGGGGSAVPRRSREAIDAGLELFQRGDFQGALEVFQLALELPGSGVERAEGRPREFACASTGEENATL